MDKPKRNERFVIHEMKHPCIRGHAGGGDGAGPSSETGTQADERVRMTDDNVRQWFGIGLGKW